MGEDELEGTPNEWEVGEDSDPVAEVVETPAEDFEARLAAARAEAAQQAREEAEANANKRIADKDRQITRTLEAVRKRGLDITDSGDLATTDVTKLAALLGQQPAQAQAPVTLPEANPFSDDFQQQLASREAILRQQVAEETTNAVLAKLMPQLQQMTGLTLASQQPQVEQAIAAQFARYGVPGMESTPEFLEYRAREVQNITDPVSLASPEWMAQMAFTFLPKASDALVASVREKAAQKASAEKAQRERQEAAGMRQQMSGSGSGDMRYVEAGGRSLAPGEYDEAYWLIRQSMQGDPRYDEQLNRAEAVGQTNKLLEKRRADKAKVRR